MWNAYFTLDETYNIFTFYNVFMTINFRDEIVGTDCLSKWYLPSLLESNHQLLLHFWHNNTNTLAFKGIRNKLTTFYVSVHG